MDKKWLEILVCPQTGGVLHWIEQASELWCKVSGLAYPVKDGVPVMLMEKARALTASEKMLLE